MKNHIKSIYSLFFAIGFLGIGYSMLMTYIGVFLKQNGMSDFTIGLINSAFFIGAILSSIFAQKIISTIGHIRSFTAFAALMAISFLLHSIYINEYFWAILRAVSGFSYYALLMILESWLNEKTPNESRGKTLGIYSTTFYLSTSIGQMLLNIGDNLKYIIFAFGSILVLLSLIMIAITKVKEPNIIPFERYSIPKIASIAPLATTGSFIAGFMVSGFFTMMPLYLLNSLQKIDTLVIFMSLTLIGGLVAQYPIGKLSDRFGRRKLIAFQAGLVTIISILFLINTNSLINLILGAILGMGIFSLYPLSVARANDVTNKNKNVVEISRTLLFIYAIGSFSAPLIIGIGYSTLGYETIFILFATLGISLFIYALSRERVPDEQLTVFVKTPPIAADILPQMDPRQDQKWVNEKSKHINTSEK